MSTDERITELEIQITHQDSTISELNDVIYSQQKAIDKLEARLLKLEGMVNSELHANIKEVTEEPPPPHY